MEALMATSLMGDEKGFYGTIWLAAAFIAGTATIVSLLGILYMTMVVAPNATQRFSAALRERNILSFFAGIPVAGVFGVTTAIFQRSQPMVSVTLLAFSVVLLLTLAASAEDIGRRLYWACGKEGSRASHLASGWMIFAFSALVPVLGWFVVAPWVVLSGLGSAVVSFLPAKPAARELKDIEFSDKDR